MRRRSPGERWTGSIAGRRGRQGGGSVAPQRPFSGTQPSSPASAMRHQPSSQPSRSATTPASARRIAGALGKGRSRIVCTPPRDERRAACGQQRLVHPALGSLVVAHPAPLIEVLHHQQRQPAALVDPFDRIAPAGADPEIGHLRLERDEARKVLGARRRSLGVHLHRPDKEGRKRRESRSDGAPPQGGAEARGRAGRALRRALLAAAAEACGHGGHGHPRGRLSRHGGVC